MADRPTILEWIEAFIITGWNSATPILFKNNEETDPDDSSKLLSDGENPYIYVAVNFADSRQIEIGPNANSRTHGVIYMEVRVKDGTGVRVAEGHISTLQTLLEYTNISDVKIRDSISRDSYSSGGWYILPLSFKFRYDRQE